MFRPLNLGQQDADLPTVLFVDDDQQTLDELTVGLASVRTQYHMEFLPTVDAALEWLDSNDADIVVTDLDMPERDGGDLLEHICHHRPEVIRYILTGPAPREQIVRAAPLSHRWITKPWNAFELITALDGALHHQHLLADPALRSAIGAATSLPTPPKLYRELIALTADPDASIDTITSLIETDPAVAAKLLQLANSAFLGGTPVDDLRAAVIRVGLVELGQLVLLAEVASAFDDGTAIPGFDPELLNTHVGLIAAVARSLSGPRSARFAALGGLFSMTGLLLQVSALPDRITNSFELAEREELTLVDAERRRTGVTHADLGGHLLALWGLPTEVVLAVGGSQLPPDPDLPDPLGAPEAVRRARLVAQRLPHATEIAAPHIEPIDPALLPALDAWQEASLDLTR